MDAYTQVDQTPPDDDAEVTKLKGAFEKFASGCDKRSGRCCRTSRPWRRPATWTCCAPCSATST
ncbi:hypothetical protein GTV15_20575 [Streptomyces sp. SID7803]|nr:hypothetical protein [Streptomyces sp. SID7803]